MYIYWYVHIYEELFSKSQSTNLELTFETFNFGMALNALWKSANHIVSGKLWRIQRDPGGGPIVRAVVQKAGAVDD